MIRRLLVAAALLSSTLALAADDDEVPEVEVDRRGPLRQRVPPVSGTFFTKGGRLEISPFAALSFKDAFFQKYVAGIEVAQHLWDELGVGARAGFARSVPGRAMQICDPPEPPAVETTCRFATGAELDGRAPGQMVFFAGGNLQWSPIYGKLSLFGLGFPNFDTYLLLGADLVGYRGPTDTGGAVLRMTVALDAAVGMRLFIAKWFTLRAELRDLVYVEQVRRLTTNVSSTRQQLFFQLGVSVFLPTVGRTEAP